MNDALREYVEKRAHELPFIRCWLWLLSCGSHGYGQGTTNSNRVTTAHRISYQAFKGEIPPGMLVQHSCDNKWCVNPDHLSLGTDKTNAIDKQVKGRAAKRLDAGTVLRIKSRLNSGESIRGVAREFGISQKSAQNIDRMHVWKHVLNKAAL